MALPGTLSVAAEAEWSPPPSESGAAVSGSTNSWHKRYVKNVTKGVSTLLWGHTKKDDSPSYNRSMGNGPRSVIEWCHVTYPTQESIPTLDFHVSRKTTICKKSRAAVSNASSGAKAPQLHARNARCHLVVSQPLALENPSLTSPSGSGGHGMVGSGATGHQRNRSRWSALSGSTGVSNGGHGSSSESGNVYRCVEALGVISVVPFGIVRTDLYGDITHRVDFKVTHLLHAGFEDVLGIGETLVCVTAAFTIAVYQVRNLHMLYDIPIHIAENVWLRYYKNHTRDPPQNVNNCSITSLALTPSSFSRRKGVIAVGSSSGLTHIWRIPERQLLSVLPPPISHRQNVLGIGFTSSEVLECIHDIASPFSQPETTETLRRINYVCLFYIDGQVAIWSLDTRDVALSQDVFPTDGTENDCDDDSSSNDHPSDRLSVGYIPPHFQFHYPCIEAPLYTDDHARLEKLITWKSPRDEWDLETVMECGDCLALFVRMPTDYGFLLLHPQTSKVLQPIQSFQDLAIPIAMKNPAAVCYALLRNSFRCLIIATPGVLRVIKLVYEDRGMALDEQDTVLVYDMDIELQLIATLTVARKTEFCKAKYDSDFDELLLGLTTGEVVRIESFTDMVVRA